MGDPLTTSLSLSHLGLSLLAGSLTTLSPCVFPILPLVVGGAVQTNRLAPVAMGVGMAASFALIGLLLGAAGPALGIDGDSVRTFGGIMLVAVAYASRSGFNKARGWVMARVETVKKAFGILIGLTGIAILSGADKWLEARVVSVLPDSWVNLTTLF